MVSDICGFRIKETMGLIVRINIDNVLKGTFVNWLCPSLNKDSLTTTTFPLMFRINDVIAFKMVEMSSNYTPEVSEYKEGRVVDIQDNLVTFNIVSQQTLKR